MNMFRFLCLCVFTFVCACANAAVPVEQDELKAYEYDIIMKTVETVSKAVTPDGIIKKYRLAVPILPPRLDEQQVTALVNKEVDAMVEAEYPKSRYKEIELEARRKFRMYKLNELVTMKVIDPRRRVNMTVTSHIRQITSKGVRLGDNFYIFRDIDRAEYAHFFRPHHDRAVEAEIGRQKTYYTKIRRDFEIKTRHKLTGDIWHSEGYVFRRKTKKWVPREMVFDYRYQKEWLEKFKEIRPDVEITEYEAAGFTWNEALERYEHPGKAGEETVAETATGTEPKKKVSESLKDWSKMVGEIFSKGKSDKDIWGEDEKGDVEQGDGEKKEKKEE